MWGYSHVPMQVPGFRPADGPQHDNRQFAIRESRRQAGAKENTPLNNNRGGNNNRRRGRTNNSPRPQGTGGGGGGQQVNRIDSRARGNAPQMLEKYRKLANDAHLNGDRVNAEYNLQFADHYFRVIADTRVRQEEQRLRRDDRWPEGGEGERDENDDAGEFGMETEFAAFDQPPVYTRREREDRPERTPERVAERITDRAPDRAPERTSEQTGERVPADRDTDRRPPSQDRPQDNRPQQDNRRRDERPARNERPRRDDQAVRSDADNAGSSQPQVNHENQAPVSEGSNGDIHDAPAPNTEVAEGVTYEPAENPFLRENRGGRGLRPRREDRRPRRQDVADSATLGENTSLPAETQAALGETQEPDRAVRAMSAGIDPATLPPSFTVARVEPEIAGEDAPTPTPRRRARRKPVVDDTGEPAQTLI